MRRDASKSDSEGGWKPSALGSSSSILNRSTHAMLTRAACTAQLDGCQLLHHECGMGLSRGAPARSSVVLTSVQRTARILLTESLNARSSQESHGPHTSAIFGELWSRKCEPPIPARSSIQLKAHILHVESLNALPTSGVSRIARRGSSSWPADSFTELECEGKEAPSHAWNGRTECAPRLVSRNRLGRTPPGTFYAWASVRVTTSTFGRRAARALRHTRPSTAGQSWLRITPQLASDSPWRKPHFR